MVAQGASPLAPISGTAGRAGAAGGASGPERTTRQIIDEIVKRVASACVRKIPTVQIDLQDSVLNGAVLKMKHEPDGLSFDIETPNRQVRELLTRLEIFAALRAGMQNLKSLRVAGQQILQEAAKASVAHLRTAAGDREVDLIDGRPPRRADRHPRTTGYRRRDGIAVVPAALLGP